MNQIAQNIAVILVVSVCIAYVAWQAAQIFRGRKSKLGSCCARGCPAVESSSNAVPKPAPVQFLPLENLRSRAKQHGRPAPAGCTAAEGVLVSSGGDTDLTKPR